MATIDADLLGDVIQFQDVLLHDSALIQYADIPFNTLQFSETQFSARLVANAAMTDVLQFSEVFAAARIANVALIDTLGYSEAWELTGAFGVQMSDSYQFSDYMNPFAPFAPGWTMNTETGAASRYDWPLYNSFTVLNGKLYGANEDGIFELEGDSDNDALINWFAMTSKSALDNRLQKVIPRGYIAVKFDGSIWLKTISGGTDQTRIYKLVSTKDEMFQRRLPLGRGVDGVYWEFALQDEAGEDFELDAILVYPVALKRRFR